MQVVKLSNHSPVKFKEVHLAQNNTVLAPRLEILKKWIPNFDVHNSTDIEYLTVSNSIVGFAICKKNLPETKTGIDLYSFPWRTFKFLRWQISHFLI